MINKSAIKAEQIIYETINYQSSNYFIQPRKKNLSEFQNMVPLSRLFPLILAMVTAVAVLGQTTEEEKRAHGKSVVEEANKKNGGKWEAKYNERIALMDDKDRKRMANGVLKMKLPPLSPENSGKRIAPPAGQNQNQMNQNQNESVPIEVRSRRQTTTSCTNQVAFDARTQWPGCSGIISKVQDQSQCGSCWAVASASVFTDRMCLQRQWKGLTTSSSSASCQYSALDILSCAPNTHGCDGGNPYYAWNWIYSSGVVTGTNYSLNSGCKPYPFAPKSTTTFSAPGCSASCTNPAWTNGYTADKKFVSYYSYFQGAGNVANIENEIRTYGPVVASIDAYEDLFYYSSGVYKRTSTNYLGGHAVRLIGWGTRSCSDGTSTPYWMAVNSWNTDWGQQGFFQIAKGTDECRIESAGIFFGDPKP